MYFTHALKWIADVCEYDYYDLSNYDYINSELLDWLNSIEKNIYINDTVKLRPLNQDILNRYINLPNRWFYNEGISLEIQEEFNIGYDLSTERITIPIYDELNTLVGVIGRATKSKDEEGYKYFPLYKYPKGEILYGLNKTLPYIKEKNECIIFEGEKSVLKCWQNKIYNTVAIGRLIPTDEQMSKILKLNCNIVFAWDSALNDPDQKKMLKEFLDKYKILANISIVYDKWNLTNKKDAPIDQGKEVFNELYNKRFKLN